MARLEVDGTDLVVRLSLREKMWGFHGDIRFPLSSVRSVTIPRNAWLSLRGWRMAGTGIPSFRAIGTWRHGDGYDFYVFVRAERVVQIDVNAPVRFSRYMIGVPDSVDVQAEADRIADAAGIARPPRESPAEPSP